MMQQKHSLNIPYKFFFSSIEYGEFFLKEFSMFNISGSKIHLYMHVQLTCLYISK